MRFVRKRRLNGENVQHKDCFDFDRLNPHQTFVQEFEDRLDNKDWAYNHTVLKMMADLNSKMMVTLGDSSGVRLLSDTCKSRVDTCHVSGTMPIGFVVKFYPILTPNTCV